MPPAVSSPPTAEQVTQALAGSTTLRSTARSPSSGWSRTSQVAADGAVRVDVWLTVSGCPLRDTITRDVHRGRQQPSPA